MNTKQKVNLNSTEFQPRKDSILVVYNEPEKEVKTDSGIIVETRRSSLERQTSGEVIAVGSDVTWLEPNDFVVWVMTDGINLELNDGEFLLLRESSILGKQK